MTQGQRAQLLEMKKSLALREQDLGYAKRQIEQLKSQLQGLQSTDIQQKLAQLDEEKNALLDYIEEIEAKKADADSLREQMLVM
jgi:patatin-like phospholipase/acyl hydrolase